MCCFLTPNPRLPDEGGDPEHHLSRTFPHLDIPSFLTEPWMELSCLKRWRRTYMIRLTGKLTIIDLHSKYVYF